MGRVLVEYEDVRAALQGVTRLLITAELAPASRPDDVLDCCGDCEVLRTDLALRDAEVERLTREVAGVAAHRDDLCDRMATARLQRDGARAEARSASAGYALVEAERTALQVALTDAVRLLDEAVPGDAWTPERQERAAAVRALAWPGGPVTPGRAVLAVVHGTASVDDPGHVFVPFGAFGDGGATVLVRPLLAVLEPPPF
jgi:hypothetical protein